MSIFMRLGQLQLCRELEGVDAGWLVACANEWATPGGRVSTPGGWWRALTDGRRRAAAHEATVDFSCPCAPIVAYLPP